MVSYQKTGCTGGMPIPALAGSRAPGLAMSRDGQVPREAGSREQPVHSRGSYGCIASRGGRGAPLRSSGDLPPGEALPRGASRSAVPLTGGRIPGYAGAPAQRLERVLRSTAAPRHTSPRQLLHALPSALASCFALPCPSMDSYLLHGPGQFLDRFAVSPSPCSRAPASGIPVRNPG